MMINVHGIFRSSLLLLTQNALPLDKNPMAAEYQNKNPMVANAQDE
jgi:hypothetical protein